MTHLKIRVHKYFKQANKIYKDILLINRNRNKQY